MRRFIDGDDRQYEWLRDQMQGALYIFKDIALPGTCTPNSCRVGFEFTPSKGYTFYIDKSIAYTGCHEAFRTLLNNGEVSCERYGDLVTLVRGLRSLYTETHLERCNTFSDRPPNREEPSPEPRDITEAALQAARSPVDIDGKRLYEGLTSKIIGQSSALTKLSDVVQIHLAKVKPGRPATLYLAGPTGVGKTESGKALVETLNEISDVNFELITIPCNQLEESHRISQLLGSPNGYIGFEDPPWLAPLAYNPRCVVLWDEIEKAHPNILKAMMRGLDEGMVKLPRSINESWELDCRFSVFLFTSNESLDNAEKRIGFSTGSEESTENVISEEDKCKEALVQNGLRPEIAGRIASFLEYKPMTRKDIAKIIRLEITKYANSFGLSVKTVDETIIEEIIKATGSKFGMRAYKQLIDNKFGKSFVASKNTTTVVTISGSLNAIKVVPCSN